MEKTLVEMRVVFGLLSKFFSYILQPLFFIVLIYKVLIIARYEPKLMTDLEIFVGFVLQLVVCVLFVSFIYDVVVDSFTKELLEGLYKRGILEKVVTFEMLVEDVPTWVKTESKLDKPVSCFSGVNSYNCLSCLGLTNVNVKRRFMKEPEIQRVELEITEYKLKTREYSTVPLGLLCKFERRAKVKFVK